MRVERVLSVLVCAAVGLPIFAVVWGGVDQADPFVLYSEPKLAAELILGWTFLAIAAWCRGRPWIAAFKPAGSEERLFWLVFCVWGLILCVSAARARVPQNAGYELLQYIYLFPLLGAVVAWAKVQADVRVRICLALCASLVPVVAFGLAQLWVPTFPLLPIDPELGAINPSFLGYKNPMALALVGQIFFVAWLAFRDLGERRRFALGLRVFWAVVLFTEVAYLMTLRSRTALGALAGGGLIFGALLVRNQKLFVPGAARCLALVGLGLCLGAATVVVAYPPAQARLASMSEFLANPPLYLESDRGVYARNTMNMVEHNPYGVGLGGWQAEYPVYRKIDRYRAFTDQHQARRPHSDHLQMLGETGWLGGLLWLAVFGSAFWVCVRRVSSQDSMFSLFAAAQLATLVFAMCLDYLVDVPYLKLQIFVVLALAVSSSSPVGWAKLRNPPWWTSRALLCIALVLGLGSSLLAVSQLRQQIEFASVRQLLLRGAGDFDSNQRLEEAKRISAVAAGRLSLHKTQYRDLTLAAFSSARLGDLENARAYLRRSLKLHPFSTASFRLGAGIMSSHDPELAGDYSEAYKYVMHDAIDGYHRRYPDLP
jgi:O-antigen ligase